MKPTRLVKEELRMIFYEKDSFWNPNQRIEGFHCLDVQTNHEFRPEANTANEPSKFQVEPISIPLPPYNGPPPNQKNKNNENTVSALFGASYPSRTPLWKSRLLAQPSWRGFRPRSSRLLAQPTRGPTIREKSKARTGQIVFFGATTPSVARNAGFWRLQTQETCISKINVFFSTLAPPFPQYLAPLGARYLEKRSIFFF